MARMTNTLVHTTTALLKATVVQNNNPTRVNGNADGKEVMIMVIRKEWGQGVKQLDSPLRFQ